MKIPKQAVRRFTDKIAKHNRDKFILKGEDKINYGNSEFIFLKAINLFKLDPERIDEIIEVPKEWKRVIMHFFDIGFNKAKDNTNTERIKNQIRKNHKTFNELKREEEIKEIAKEL